LQRPALLSIFTVALHAAVFLRANCRVEYGRMYEEISMTESFSPFRLCFRSLFEPGRGYAFPCDCNGLVVLDDLSETARNNYFYARAMVGRELTVPAIEPDAA
jgi:hypothetical protein